ncbi:hypothetical protein B0T14DRAFT_508265 [Immersiella caudata]|uniref:RBR-type E3 ubiquitin transferase n=1 Tax=Immersiella caudata TaxID=314043 RepID=A0AA39XHD4_9PEZI|nr:hypothetical protein B0T14DRAFT_508265 [Immersiella caudata]
MLWLKKTLSLAFGKDKTAVQSQPDVLSPTFDFGFLDRASSSTLEPPIENGGSNPQPHRNDFDPRALGLRSLAPGVWGPPLHDPFWEPVLQVENGGHGGRLSPARSTPSRFPTDQTVGMFPIANLSLFLLPASDLASVGPFASGALPAVRKKPVSRGTQSSRATPISIDRQSPTPSTRTRSSNGYIEHFPTLAASESLEEEKECVICAETKQPGGFPLLCASSRCNHPPETCRSCLRQHIRTALADKAWHSRVVTCPECNNPMEYDEVRMHADRATFEVYDARTLNDAISQRSDWFNCPNHGCGSGQIHDAGDRTPIVTCVGCGQKHCFRHRVAWHETMSCVEYDRFLADPENFRSAFELENERVEQEREAEERRRRKMQAADFQFAKNLVEDERVKAEAEERDRKEEAARVVAERLRAEREAAQRKAEAAARAKAAENAKRRAKENTASEATVKRTTKKCPGCSWPIEKNSGCAHMTCIKCSHHFCWNCLGEWGNGHTSCRRK